MRFCSVLVKGDREANYVIYHFALVGIRMTVGSFGSEYWRKSSVAGTGRRLERVFFCPAPWLLCVCDSPVCAENVQAAAPCIRVTLLKVESVSDGVMMCSLFFKMLCLDVRAVFLTSTVETTP